MTEPIGDWVRRQPDAVPGRTMPERWRYISAADFNALKAELGPGDGRPMPSQPDAVLTMVDASGGRWLAPAWIGPVTRAGADEERTVQSFADSGLTVVVFTVVHP